MFLEKMTPSKYKESFRTFCINELASQHVENGTWPERGAVSRAQEKQDSTLPNGVDTKDQYLYTLRDECGKDIGSLWFGKLCRDEEWFAFVFLVYVDPACRRMGHATTAMRQMERLVSDVGLHRIQLHVFRSNQPAIKLYEGLGYACIGSNGPSMILEKKVERKECRETGS